MVFFKLTIVLILMISLLRKRIPIVYALFASSLLLFFLTSLKVNTFVTAAQHTLMSFTTWNMLITLYFIMCLENVLRTSGILKSFTVAARNVFGSERALLAFMPSFLGFLPSLGGAIFSAPMVKEAGRRYGLSSELNTSINLWFRHIWQYSNPILPALLLASAVTKISLSTIVIHQFIFSVAALIIGILFLLTGKAYNTRGKKNDSEPKDSNPKDSNPKDSTPKESTSSKETYSAKELRNSIALAAGPILANVFLVAFLDMNTALSMGLVLMVMIFMLKFNPSQIQRVFFSSMDFKIQGGIISILFFQAMLNTTGTIDEIIIFFQSTGIPVVAVISLAAFFIGFATSIDQSFVAVAFPLIGPLAGGSLDVFAMAYLAGTAGMMLSPTHLCLLVSVEYFKADFIKSLMPILIMEIILVAFGFAYLFIF